MNAWGLITATKPIVRHLLQIDADADAVQTSAPADPSFPTPKANPMGH